MNKLILEKMIEEITEFLIEIEEFKLPYFLFKDDIFNS